MDMVSSLIWKMADLQEHQVVLKSEGKERINKRVKGNVRIPDDAFIVLGAILYRNRGEEHVGNFTVPILSPESIWSVMGFRNFNLINLVHTNSEFHN